MVTHRIPATVVFDLLRADRRRTALAVLEEHRESLRLPDLADEVAVRERGVRLPEVPAEAVKRVYGSLYHRHVPKLSDAGVVDYHQERDVVSTAPRFDRLQACRARLGDPVGASG